MHTSTPAGTRGRGRPGGWISASTPRGPPDPAARPPRHAREGPIYVRDERRDQVVYEGPDATMVPVLMDALVVSLHGGGRPASPPTWAEAAREPVPIAS